MTPVEYTFLTDIKTILIPSSIPFLNFLFKELNRYVTAVRSRSLMLQRVGVRKIWTCSLKNTCAEITMHSVKKLLACRPPNLLKKTPARVFFCQICKIFMKSFSQAKCSFIFYNSF